MTLVTGMIYERVLLSGGWKNVFIPNAKVSFQGTDTTGRQTFGATFTVDTQLTGTYQLDLPPGHYNVRISRDEYITYDTRDMPGRAFVVRDISRQQHDFPLTTGQELAVSKKVTLDLRVNLEPKADAKPDDPALILKVQDLPQTFAMNLTRHLFTMPPWVGYEHKTDDLPFAIKADATLSDGRFTPADGHGSCRLTMEINPKVFMPVRMQDVQFSTKNRFENPNGGQDIFGASLSAIDGSKAKFIRMVGRTRVIQQRTRPRGKIKYGDYDGLLGVISLTVTFEDTSDLS